MNIGLSSEAFSLLATDSIPSIVAYIQQIPIPDIEGEAHERVGKVHWKLKNIIMESLNASSCVVSLVSGPSLNLEFESISSKMKMDWEYSFWTIWKNTGKGKADVNFDGANASMIIQLNEVDGKLQLNFENVKIQFGDFSLHLHGGASWFVNLFKKDIINNLKKESSAELQQLLVDKYEPEWNDIFGNLTMRTIFSQQLGLDYNLVNAASLNNNFITFPTTGMFFPVNEPNKNAPFPPDSIPISIASNTDAQIIFGNYFFNTAGWALQTSGILDATITNNEVPANSPVQLNTSYFEDIVPPLYQKYPNLLMTLQLSSSSWPQTVIDNSGLNLIYLSQMAVNVITKNNTVLNAFVLGLSSSANIDLLISGNIVQGTISGFNVTINLQSSNVGRFDISYLQEIFTIVGSSYIVPAIASYLKQGFQIPTMDGISLVNASAIFQQNCVVINSNIAYTPSQLNPANLHAISIT